MLGNRGRVFCAGAELRDLDDGGDTAARLLVRLLERIQMSPIPVIAAVEGHAVGGGVGLVAACDISVVSNDVLLGFTEVRPGVAPAIIAVVCLPKMSLADVLELFLRGQKISAKRAVEGGLVNKAVPAGELSAAVAEVASDDLLGGPEAPAAAKAMVMSRGGSRSFEAMTALSQHLFASAEAREGRTAFLDRRRPAWASR